MPCCVARTPLAVGAADLDGGQIVEKLLEVGVADARPPGVVGAVVEPEAEIKSGLGDSPPQTINPQCDSLF